MARRRGDRTMVDMTTEDTSPPSPAYAHYEVTVVLPHDDITIRLTCDGSPNDAMAFMRWVERLERHSLVTFDSFKKTVSP